MLDPAPNPQTLPASLTPAIDLEGSKELLGMVRGYVTSEDEQ